MIHNVSNIIERRDWNEFRKTGLLLLVNQFLHIFGWTIVIEIDEDGHMEVYPARTKFRGFAETNTNLAYKRISVYMKEHGQELVNETADL